MSKTIGQVQEAFHKGEAAHTGRYSLDSDRNGLAEAMALRSYRTTIAIRRDRDGAEFWDGHSYSTTTSRHQSGHDPAFSFDCVAELMGPRWWERAAVADWGPRYCADPQCEKETEDLRALYDAGLVKDFPHRECFSPNEGGQHSVEIDGYNGWYGTAVLLAFDGQRVLCGFERGKRGRWGGDQLWAALLPTAVDNVRQAFRALQPRFFHNIRVDEHDPAVGAKRQGDLFFVPCYNGDGPPTDTVNLDGVALPLAADRANHRASKVRFSPTGGYTGERGAPTACRIWARGNIDHPEHPRLRLGCWHRVYRSAAVRAVSSAYRHSMGGSGGARGD